MSVVKVGDLVRAIGECLDEAEVDYQALGVVVSIKNMLVVVKWPGVKKPVNFSLNDLERVDAN